MIRPLRWGMNELEICICSTKTAVSLNGISSYWRWHNFFPMSEGTSQTKISVKKSDGTVVRMTLAEFKEYKKQLTNNTPTVSQPVTDSETTAPVLPPVTAVEEQEV